MTRAEQAQRLVDEGRVFWVVKSWPFRSALVRGDTDTYQVTLYPNDHYICACPWGTYHSHTDDLCAHALAVRMAVEREASDAQRM